jgi:hypothetical protein
MEKIDSTFAILDVKRGRVALAKRTNRGETRIPVTIRGYIVNQHGNDDGTSIEFEIEVTDAVERLR